MAIEKLVQNFADATGIIVDHTLNPPRVLGQAFLVSKSRLVTSAGCVFNYIEAPWALSINFPHPGLASGVKSIALHPEFDRKEARLNYLSQNAVTKNTYPVQVNDLATLVMSTDIKEPLPEEIVQLHKALSLPFAREGVEASGGLKDEEFLEVVKKLISSNRQGLLTLYDELNIPIAYLQISTAAIERVYFRGIIGEMAFAELVYRQPAKGFAFQPNYNFAWGELKKIEMSATDLISESIRRTQELPHFFGHVGNINSIYQKVTQDFSVETFNPNIQWLVNNLWHALDGYITVDNLSERVGADTYTIVQGLRELSNRGVISIINKSSPFHLNQQLGTPIISHTDFDINPGDALKAFYLDPLSGAPYWQDGEFAGVASVLQPKNLLHSIPINIRIPGALVLKNYKLIGVHSGAVQLKAGQNIDRQLFQMIWIGALFDMSSKKLRSSSEVGEEEEQINTGGKLSTLRVRGEEEVKVPKNTVEKLIKYNCPVCFATNTKLGNCFNCGAPIDNVPVEVERKGFFIDKLPVKLVSDLQEKHNIPDRHIFIAAGIIVVLFLLFIGGLFNSHQTPRITNSTISQIQSKNAEQAVNLASDVVGFKRTAPEGYVFEDTSALTNPLSSFGIFSTASNQKILFVIFNDLSPLHALDRFIQIPPFSDVTVPTNSSNGVSKIAEGSQILGEGNFHYYVHTYPTSTAENDKANKVILVGSFLAKEAGKSVLVIGQALKDGNYDYKSTLFLVDAMAEPLTLSANRKRLAGTKSSSGDEQSGYPLAVDKEESGVNKNTAERSDVTDNKFATDEELNRYYQSLQEMLRKKTAQSSDLREIVFKRIGKKLKVVLEVDLNKNGQLTKIDITEPDKEQKVNDILVKIIRAAAPYKNVPRTESGQLELRIVFDRTGQLKIESR